MSAQRAFRSLRGCAGSQKVQGGAGEANWTGLAVETAAASDMPDWKEMLN